MGLCQNTSTPAHQPALYKLQTIVKCSHRSLGGGSTADTIASHPPHSTFDGISQRRCIKTYLSTITWHWPKIGPMSLVTVTFPAAAGKLIYREITVGLVLLSLAPDSRAWLPPALFIIFNCFTCGSFSNLAILFHKRHVYSKGSLTIYTLALGGFDQDTWLPWHVWCWVWHVWRWWTVDT